MSLRTKLLLYLAAIHLVLGGLAVVTLRERPWLLLAAEFGFVASAAAGVAMVRSFFVPLELIRTGAELIRERDFTSRFRQVGQHELDELVRLYNSMADRLRQERLRLEEQNLLLDKVIDASPNGVLTLDHDGRIAQLNPAAARLAGREAGMLAGRTLDALPEPLAGALGDLGTGGSAVVALADGRRLNCRGGAFYDRGFERRFYVIEELTRELRATERAAYGKLIRMMSHEVNNTVGSVRSLLDSCRAYSAQLAPDDRTDFDHAMTVAADRLQHLNAFMNGLAEVVRIPPPERRPCDVGRLLGDLVRVIGPELERRRIRLEWTPPGRPVAIELDKNQIERVLVNVLKNAVEAIGEDGSIRVALERGTLSVRDTGGGLAPEVQPLLFQPFVSTKREGQGIGLTLIREILERHGFSFDLRNVPGGAEFRIHLRPRGGTRAVAAGPTDRMPLV